MNTVKLEPSNLGNTPVCEIDLTNGSGKIFKFTHAARVILMMYPPIPVKFGEILGWDIPVTNKAKLESGDYFLSVTTQFEKKDKLFFLSSSSLKVRVK